MLTLGFVLSSLAGCSTGDDGGSRAEPGDTGSSEQALTATERREDGAAAPAQRRPVRLLLLGRFEFTHLRHRAAGRPPALRRGARRQDHRRAAGVASSPRRSSTSPTAYRRPRARAASFRWPSRATTAARGASTSTTPTTRASSRSTSSGVRVPTETAPTEGSRRSVIRVPHPRFNHKGGQVQVGPDGNLYAGFGDGGGGGDPDENAQNLGRMLGKLIRIDPKAGGGYSVPASNPFAWSLGCAGRDLCLRPAQPLPLLIRPLERSLTIGDVGQDAVEEIYYLPGRSRRAPAARRHQLRLGRLRGPQPLRGRKRTGTRAARDQLTTRRAASARSSAAM